MSTYNIKNKFVSVHWLDEEEGKGCEGKANIYIYKDESKRLLIEKGIFSHVNQKNIIENLENYIKE